MIILLIRIFVIENNHQLFTVLNCTKDKYFILILVCDVIADHTGSEMVVVSGEANVTSLDGLCESFRKTKVEITNIG